MSFYRNIGAAAAERAKIYEEFMARKRAEAINRQKAQGGYIANNVRASRGFSSFYYC